MNAPGDLPRPGSNPFEASLAVEVDRLQRIRPVGTPQTASAAPLSTPAGAQPPRTPVAA